MYVIQRRLAGSRQPLHIAPAAEAKASHEKRNSFAAAAGKQSSGEAERM